MTEEQINKVLEDQKFTWAKTYAKKSPHWWSARKEWEDQRLFEYVVQYIRDHGMKERFYRVFFTYYYANGYKYWTMGNPVDETTIINRAKV